MNDYHTLQILCAQYAFYVITTHFFICVWLFKTKKFFDLRVFLSDFVARAEAQHRIDCPTGWTYATAKNSETKGSNMKRHQNGNI